MKTELFGAPTLIGVRVKLDRPVDRERPCCLNVCTIGPARGPHAGELVCAGCGQHRGWLSRSTAQWIEHVITRFGAPTTPIIMRKSHTYEEETSGHRTEHALKPELKPNLNSTGAEHENRSRT